MDLTTVRLKAFWVVFLRFLDSCEFKLISGRDFRQGFVFLCVFVVLV